MQLNPRIRRKSNNYVLRRPKKLYFNISGSRCLLLKYCHYKFTIFYSPHMKALPKLVVMRNLRCSEDANLYLKLSYLLVFDIFRRRNVFNIFLCFGISRSASDHGLLGIWKTQWKGHILAKVLMFRSRFLI